MIIDQRPSRTMCRFTSVLTLDRESTVLVMDWWKVIEALASFVANGSEVQELDSDWAKQALMDLGFSRQAVDDAYDWLEMASVSGHVTDVLSMAQPTFLGQRMASPLERIFISDKIWQRMQDLRQRGLIGADSTERILESIRSTDTRDWDDFDIEQFFEEVLSHSLPSMPTEFVKRMSRFGAVVPEFYS